MNNNFFYIGKQSNKIKRIKILCLLLMMALTNNTLSSAITNKSNKDIDSIYSTAIDDYTLEDIHNFIYSSPYLTDKEKDYLYNTDFLTDFLECINQSPYLKYKYQFHFNNIRIESYGLDDIIYENALGYYSIDNPEVIKIRDYSGFDYQFEDTISHEFIHLCQDTSGYNLIIEACAEIISYEYYENTTNNTYSNQVKLVKKLMEIIGSDAIWHYNFTGDFSLIEKAVRPYLSSEEYNQFLNDLTFNYSNEEENISKYKDLDNLLAILHKNIYHYDIEDNEIISLINKNEWTLVRYYFNHRYDESYYIDYNQGEYEYLSYEQAIANNVIHIYAYKRKPITYKEAMEELIIGNYAINREIDLNSNKINIYSRVDSHNKTYIKGVIDGKVYDNANVDDLVMEGIIKVNYYLVDIRLLNYEEYINHNYPNDYEIKIRHSDATIINNDNVYGFVYKRITLPKVHKRTL